MRESHWFILFKKATKRKHKEVTLKIKYKVLKELDQNKPSREVTIQFNAPGSTLASWKKQLKNLPSFPKFIKETAKSQGGEINDALLKWFTSMCRNDIPIIVLILLEKAVKFPKSFNYGNFKESNRWLRALKER